MDSLTRVYSRVASEEKISNAVMKESLFGRSALYLAKLAGKNKYVFYDEINH